MRKLAIIVTLMFFPFLSLFAQADKTEVRRGNSDYRKSNYKEAELHYRKAAMQDSTSFAAVYDLANTLYQQKDFDGASNTLAKMEKQAADNQYGDRYFFNKGNVSLQKKDYKTAVDDFKQALLRDPSDVEAKESYLYAKKMLQNQQNGGGGGQDNQENQDQQNDQSQQQNDQNRQNQDQQDKDQSQQQGEQNQQISKSQAQQMLKAIQAQEKETQQKVEKAKAEKAKTRQKDKNW